MIAHLIDPSGGSNAEAALRGHLSLSHGFDLQTIDRSKKGAGETAVRGTLWKPVGASAGDELANVHAPFAVEGEVTRGPTGEIRGVRLAEPAPEEVTEAAALVRSPRATASSRGGSPADAATHDIETDDQAAASSFATAFARFERVALHTAHRSIGSGSGCARAPSSRQRS
jgi:hypothetical protein